MECPASRRAFYWAGLPPIAAQAWRGTIDGTKATKNGYKSEGLIVTLCDAQNAGFFVIQRLSKPFQPT
jgi:hypothetical protein